MKRIVGCCFATLVPVFVAARADAQAVPTESALVTAPGPQQVWGNQPDGAGGQYVVYRQPRGADRTYDIYLQRVGPSGWSSPVRVSDGVQDNEAGFVVRTPSGVAVTWSATGPDITRARYQRFTPAGAPVLATPGGGQQAEVNASIASGDGAIILVRKADSGAYQYFLQRLDERGTLAWQSASLGMSDPGVPASLCGSPTGDAIVVVGGAQVVAFKYSGAGAPSWGQSGVPVTSVYGDKAMVSTSCDANGGVAIGWLDARRGPMVHDAFVQHVDTTGHPVMTANGVEVGHDAGQQYSGELSVADDGAMGAFAEFTQVNAALTIVAYSPVYTMSVARVTRDSRIAFGSNLTGRVEPERYSTRTPRIAPDGKGGAFVSWQAAPTTALSSTLDINCVGLRWIDGTGANAWGAAPVRVGRCGAWPSQATLAVDNGTFSLAWTDSRVPYTDVYGATASTPGTRSAPIPPGPMAGVVVKVAPAAAAAPPQKIAPGAIGPIQQGPTIVNPPVLKLGK
jgi:hypothetical protein